jgi:hypothetical protein
MNRVAVAVGVGILGLAAWLMVRNHNSSLMDRIEEIDAGRPKWKEKEVRALMEKAETSWAEAAAALDRGDLDASFFAYRDALHPLHTYVLHYGENEVEPGLTLAAWFDRRDSDYREKIAPAFDRLIARLETGDFPIPTSNRSSPISPPSRST